MSLKHRMDVLCTCMHEYQKNNNITSQCISNTLFLYQQLKPFDKDNKISVENVLMLGKRKIEDEGYVITAGHIVLMFEGDVIEASYEFQQMQEKTYFNKLNQMLKGVSDLDWPSQEARDICRRHVVTTFLEFTEVSKSILNGTCDYWRTLYFKEQVKYVVGRVEELNCLAEKRKKQVRKDKTAKRL